ncbi:hypothetical protein [Sphingomonas pituitosa]|uniref:hypothetical protein n=1 Tax=Sphingomonas pituitosa TaxID=99597 RepID=UPI000A484C27|nr:hypothetical protein [Sphingomonas pituitosa]
MNTFFYVSHPEAQYWEQQGIDWRATALTNLADVSTDLPASGEKLDQAGHPFLKVMLHKDALGPSRLLLPKLFDEALGPGYKVAIPERTCAIAFREDLSAEQARDVDAMINGCFEHGTEPMSPARFDAWQFWTSIETAARR